MRPHPSLEPSRDGRRCLASGRFGPIVVMSFAARQHLPPQAAQLDRTKASSRFGDACSSARLVSVAGLGA
jgi:hypothetical protein